MKILKSPNFNKGRKGPVELIVLHYISIPPGEFGTDHVIDLFMSRLNPAVISEYEGLEGLRVSAHYFINRTGEVIQFVDTENVAWHAGESCFEGRENCNQYSIGIELEGDSIHPFEDAQYDALVDLCRALMERYPDITPDRIVGHSDVAFGRKEDPGPMFDWDLFRKGLSDAIGRAKV